MGKFSRQAIAYIEAPPKRLNLLYGSVRSGKTTNMNFVAPRRFANAPHGDILITGKTERTVYRNVIRPLQEMWGSRVKYLKGSAEGSIAGRPFYVAGANNEAAEGKIQGLTVAYWMADEAVLYPESFVRQALARMSPEGACADLSMNPGGPYHYLKTEFIDRAAELDAAVWHFLLEHNPNLPPSYVASLKAEYGEGTLWYKRFIQGLWVAAEGAVYDFFSEREHVAPLPEGAPEHLDVAIDYGTSNATAMGLYGAWPGGRSALIRSYTHSGRESGQQKTDSEYAEALRGFLQGVTPRWIILDPSAASFKAELRRRGYRVRDANNDVLDGIRTTARLMKAGRFTIGPDPSNRAASF